MEEMGGESVKGEWNRVEKDAKTGETEREMKEKVALQVKLKGTGE